MAYQSAARKEKVFTEKGGKQSLAAHTHLVDLYLHKVCLQPGKRSKLKAWEQALADYSDLSLHLVA